MREIKFRAWDKNNKIMVYSTEEFELVVGVSGVYLLDSEPYGHQEPDLIPLLFTGRKDKTGEEIYEGYLLKSDFSSAHIVLEVCFGEYDNGEEYSERIVGNGWYIKEHGGIAEGKSNIGRFFSAAEEIEIIGNIYEDEELLDEKISKKKNRNKTR